MAKKQTLKELKTLGHNLLTSRAHINNLPILIAVITPTSPPQHALETLLSLQSFFTPLLPQLPSSAKAVSNRGEDPETVFRVWCRAKFDELVKGLVDVFVSPQCDETLRDVVLDTIMDFVKVGNGGKFYSALYHRLLNNMVLSVSPVDFLFESLASKYFKYIDVRYFTYISLEKIVKTMETKESQDKKVGSTDNNNENQSETSMEQFIRKTHYIISHVPALESRDQTSDHEMWSDSGSVIIDDDQEKQSNHLKSRDKRPENEQQNCNELSPAKIVKKIKLKFSKAWISFLLLPLPLDVYKGVLSTLHQAVIPYMSNPPVLCDFLTRSYDIGGVISVMALSSLFILMTQYGLEYPNFYDKLYALLTPSIFMAKHRAKFFQLLDSCLKSPLLPAYLAASFAKKLSRLAISVPPSGGIIIIALIHNLLRRHPSINFLVHWEDLDAVDESNVKNSYADDVEVTKTDINNCHKRLGADHFNSEENNPMKTNAMRSSLWEIDTLRHHYCPSVSRFVSSLEEDLTVRAKTTEIDIKDFSAASYATIFGDEIRRRVKQVPLAFYKATPTSLFSESDFAGWTFNYKDLMEKDDGLNENATEDTTSSKRQRIEWQ